MRRHQSKDTNGLLTVYILGVNEDKPKPVQAQAIKARTAKFKLRHAGQARFASPSDKSVLAWASGLRFPKPSQVMKPGLEFVPQVGDSQV
jgi:hypothetical protein